MDCFISNSLQCLTRSPYFLVDESRINLSRRGEFIFLVNSFNTAWIKDVLCETYPIKHTDF